jgi:hypothetical protein
MGSAVLSSRSDLSRNPYSSFETVELPFQIQIMGLQIHHHPESKFLTQHRQPSPSSSSSIWNDSSDRDPALVL